MPDREKVIKGLEWCMNEKHDCYKEKGCPYENEGEDIGCKYALHRDALALLKAQEQEHIVPIRRSAHEQGADDVWYECGKCGKFLGVNPCSKKICPNCGRVVKWE